MLENLTVVVASEVSAVILLDARSRYYKMSMEQTDEVDMDVEGCGGRGRQ